MTQTPVPSHVLIDHFAAKLAFETDPADAHAALVGGEPVVVVDSRGHAAWAQGRIQGALHMPTADIAAQARQRIPVELPVVVYCWGPGCNGATRAALEFARQGYQVKEMIGGYEYWAREGYPVENNHGPLHRPIDDLTAPVRTLTCDC
ncbi:rhodanese-like domain-containing protein [Kocuria sp. NPDC057446]|uniref:rhodanese-like domain-containing protein n=1 Tax=Kocuria sp. NPDC057446 TaxID=3346137 RepID=UPI0036826655